MPRGGGRISFSGGGGGLGKGLSGLGKALSGIKMPKLNLGKIGESFSEIFSKKSSSSSKSSDTRPSFYPFYIWGHHDNDDGSIFNFGNENENDENETSWYDSFKNGILDIVS